MKRMTRARFLDRASAGNARRAGFTLLELMISVAILGIVVAGVFESLTRQHRTSVVTESVVEVQNNVRAIASLIEREIRMAGYMVPDAAGVCGLDDTDGADELYVSENEAIVPDDARAGDMGARLSSTYGPWSNISVSTDVALDASTSDLDGDGELFYDNDGDGTADADFRVGGGFILADKANPHRGLLCGRVTEASTAELTLVPVAGGLAAHDAINDAEEEIVIVPAARYAMNATAGSTRLERNGELLAQGVEDFQISYFYDQDEDGVIDATVDFDGDGTADPGMTEEPGSKTGPTYDPADWDNTTLREVRFSIVVRTRATDQAFDDGAFIVKENRTDPAAGNDGFRRRVVVGAVRPRNVGNAGSI